MQWLYTVFYTFLAIALFPYVAGLFLPRKYAISREIIVARPAREVFDFLKLLKNQEHYSTYMRADPAMKTKYRGVDGTEGAIVAWESNDRNVGKGEQEIKALEDGRRIEIEIRFAWPFQSADPLVTEIEAISPQETRVTNTYRGKIRYPYNLLVWWVMAKVRENMQASLDNARAVLERGEARA